MHSFLVLSIGITGTHAKLTGWNPDEGHAGRRWHERGHFLRLVLQAVQGPLDSLRSLARLDVNFGLRPGPILEQGYVGLSHGHMRAAAIGRVSGVLTGDTKAQLGGPRTMNLQDKLIFIKKSPSTIADNEFECKAFADFEAALSQPHEKCGMGIGQSGIVQPAQHIFLVVTVRATAESELNTASRFTKLVEGQSAYCVELQFGFEDVPGDWNRGEARTPRALYPDETSLVLVPTWRHGFR